MSIINCRGLYYTFGTSGKNYKEFISKYLQLNNLKIRIAMNAKISVFVICVEAIMYLLLYNLHDCTLRGTPNY